MKKKYLYNGQLIDETDVMDAAKQSGLDINAYAEKAGMKAVDDIYSYQGKDVSAEDILDAANESKLGFDDYVQKAGFQKKNLGGNGSPHYSDKFLSSPNEVFGFDKFKTEETPQEPDEYANVKKPQKVFGVGFDRKSHKVQAIAPNEIRVPDTGNGSTEEIDPKNLTPLSIEEASNLDKNVLGNIWNHFTSGVGKLAAGAADITANLLPTPPGMTRDEFLKQIRTDVVEPSRTATTELFGANVTPEEQKAFSKNFLARATGGLAEMLPALGGKGSGMILQGYDNGLESINSTPNGRALPENTKTIFAGTVGTTVGLMNMLALDKIFGKQTNKIASEIAADALGNLVKSEGGSITAEMAEKAIISQLKSLKGQVLNGTIKVGRGAIIGGAIGAAQEGANLLAEHILNKTQDKPIFDEQSWKENLGRIVEAGATGAIGGGILGGISVPFSKTRNYIAERVAGAKNSNDIVALKNELTSSKNLSEAEAGQINDMIDNYVRVNSRVPDDVPNRKETVEKIIEREEVEKTAQEKAQELENVDDAFKPQIQQEVATLNNKVQEINEDIVNPKPEVVEEAPIEQSSSKPVDVPLDKEQDALPDILKKELDNPNKKIVTSSWDNYNAIQVEIPVDLPKGVEPTTAFKTIKKDDSKKVTEPIEVIYNPHTKEWNMMDGNHRLAQAIANGDKMILANVGIIADSMDGGVFKDYLAKPKSEKQIKQDVPLVDKDVNKNIQNEKINTEGQNKSDANIIKPLDEKTIKEKLSGIDKDEVVDPYDNVLHYFANDGKINGAAIEELFGGKDKRLRISASTENERRARISLIVKDAPSIDALAHQLWESDPTGKHETSDYKNAIEQVLLSYNSKYAMAKDFIEKYDYETAYTKYLDQQGKEIFDNLSDEEMNHILELDADATKAQEMESYIDGLIERKTPPPIEPLKEEVEGEGNKVGVSHESLTNLAEKLGLNKPERGGYVQPEDYAARGRKLLEAGANPDEVNNPNNELHDRISIARAHLENLVAEADKIARENPDGVTSKEYKEANQKVEDYATNVVKKLGTAAHMAMVSLQGERDIDTGSFTQVRKSLQDKTGKPATKAQDEKIKELTEKNESLKKQTQDLEAKLIEATDKSISEESKKLNIKDKAKDIADRLRRQAKIHRPDSFSAATPASLVWDGAVEIVAKTIESGGTVAQAIADGIAHIKKSGWYNKLADKEKQKAEKDFSEWHEGELVKSGDELENLQKQFLNKTDNKFSMDEAKDIWEYAKKNYLDKGVSYRDMISLVRSDLGLSWKQVSSAITSPKVKPVSDAMWKKQSDYMRSQTATKNWLLSQTDNPLYKALKRVSSVFRGSAVFGHGAIFVGTHSGMTLFSPTLGRHTVKAFLNGYKFAYGNRGNYERRMEALKNESNYVLAQRAGLKNNPDIINAEEYQKSQFMKTGERGFNAIKVLRQQLFDAHYNHLSDEAKADPNTAKAVAWLVNNATGATNLKIPEAINEITFAGGMEAARWGKLTRNPLKASQIALRALINPKDVPISDRVFAKLWARRVGEQLGTFAGLLLANAALQNAINPKNPVNTTNPKKPDYLKFKFGDIAIDPTSGMRGTANFIYGLGAIPFKSKKELHGDNALQAAGKQTFGYGRGKLSPFYSTVVDFYTQKDFKGNPLPTSNEEPTTGHHKVSWIEYLLQKSPLPVAEAAQEMYNAALNNGGDKLTTEHIVDGIISGGLSGATGFRVGEYNTEERNHDQFTEKELNDDTNLKNFVDKGIDISLSAKDQYTIPRDEKHPEGKMTKTDYDKFSEMATALIKSKVGKLANSDIGKKLEGDKLKKAISSIKESAIEETKRNMASQGYFPYEDIKTMEELEEENEIQKVLHQ